VGVTQSDLDLIRGVGPQDAGACVSEGRYFDWLAGLKVNVSVLH